MRRLITVLSATAIGLLCGTALGVAAPAAAATALPVNCPTAAGAPAAVPTTSVPAEPSPGTAQPGTPPAGLDAPATPEPANTATPGPASVPTGSVPADEPAGGLTAEPSTGTDESGTEESGTEESGAEESGAEESDAEESGADGESAEEESTEEESGAEEEESAEEESAEEESAEEESGMELLVGEGAKLDAGSQNPESQNPESQNPATPAAPADCQEQLTELQPTAAESFGWGPPPRSAEFADGLGPDWQAAGTPAPDGGGQEMVAALSVHTGLLSIGENLAGGGRGACWTPAQEHGRWEARMKAAQTGAPINAVAQLRPAAAGGQPATEIEFVNLSDPTRRSAFARVRPGKGPAQAVGEVSVDATRWHSWAVEVTPNYVTAFVDGRPYFHSTETSALPPGPKIMCIELQRPPAAGSQPTQTPILQVDWVRQYPLPPAASGPVG